MNFPRIRFFEITYNIFKYGNSYWFIILLFFFMLKKIANISKYSIFNYFIFFFQSKQISYIFSWGIIYFVFKPKKISYLTWINFCVDKFSRLREFLGSSAKINLLNYFGNCPFAKLNPREMYTKILSKTLKFEVEDSNSF